MRILGLSIVVLTLSGCITAPEQKPIPDDPYYAPVYPDGKSVKAAPTGSIYQDSIASSLYSDLKARRVGDIITISLEETTTAKKSAQTDLSKKSNTSLLPIAIGNNTLKIAGTPVNISTDNSGASTNKSNANQSNSLSGSITANVIQVLDNGNLIIRGEKWITINNGEEFIRLTGMIRPQDIDTNNIIASTRVANARIQYSGKGTFADNQNTGWFNKFFFSSWWPF